MNLFKATVRDAPVGFTLFLLLRCSKFPLYPRKVYSALLGCIFLLLSSAGHTSTLQLHSSTSVATAGYYQLTWSWPEAPANTIYSLVEFNSSNKNPNGHEIYAGPDLASVISGKRNGTYRYVVRAMGMDDKVLALSDPLKIVVAHHSLIRAWLIFALGAVVFIAIILVIRIESVKHGRNLRQ